MSTYLSRLNAIKKALLAEVQVQNSRDWQQDTLIAVALASLYLDLFDSSDSDIQPLLHRAFRLLVHNRALTTVTDDIPRALRLTEGSRVVIEPPARPFPRCLICAEQKLPKKQGHPMEKFKVKRTRRTRATD